MARQKSANTQRDQWAIWKAVEIAVDLIESEELDVDGPARIVVEALDAAGWDDVVVEGTRPQLGNVRNLWQVKRQNTPFSLSEVEAILKSMAVLATASGKNDRFCFGAPHEVKVKIAKTKTLSFRTLRELTNTARTTGVNPNTFATGGPKEEQAWCDLVKASVGASAWDEVVNLLAKLEIHELGTEPDLRARATDKLRNTYRNAGDLIDRLVAYMLQHADGRIEISSDVLRKEILKPHGQRETTRVSWFRATRLKAWDPWQVAGPIGADEIVDETWNTAGDGAVVRITATPQPVDGAVEAALLRMAAHRAQNVNAEFSKPDDWLRYIRERSGGTFGFESDCQGVALRPVPAGLRSCSSPAIPPKQLADSLQEEMDAWTWSKLKTEMATTLGSPALLGLTIEAALLEAIAKLWSSWEQALDIDEPLRSHFLAISLATKQEWSRAEFDRKVRVGEKAVRPLARALILALAIGIALDPGTVALRPTMLDGANLEVGAFAAHVIALAFASRAGHQFGLKVTDAAPYFLQDELGCTILSEAEAPPDALALNDEGQAVPYNVPSAAGADYQSAYVPKPVLTNEVEFRRALAAGSDAVRKFLATRFQKFADAEWAFLHEAVERAGGGESQ